MKNHAILLPLLLVAACTSNGEREKLAMAKAEQDSLEVIALRKKTLREDSIKEAELKEVERLRKAWQVDTFNDEFGEPTKEKFIGYNVQGTFSNSATSNEILFVRIFVTKNNIGIFLHEYAANKPAQKFDARIKMKNSNGKEFQVMSVTPWNQDGGIAVSYFDPKLKNLIKKSEGIIKVVIHDEYSSSYRFDIDMKGFNEEFGLL